MEKLLWFLFGFRLLRVLAPYIIGVLGGLLLLSLVGQSGASGFGLLGAIGVAAGLASGLRERWSQPPRGAGWHLPQVRPQNRRRRRFDGRL